MPRRTRSAAKIEPPNLLCCDQRLQDAIAACRGRGAQITPLRERTLAALWRAGRPMGAYALRDALSAELGRALTAPTVYRTLDYLCAQGVATRIECRNAYVACAHPEDDHACVLFVCDQCGRTVEVENKKLERLLARDAENLGFVIDHHVVELSGSCADCQVAGK